MNNVQRLAKEGNKNHRLFAATIIDLMNSQGFYGRLYRAINGLSETAYSELFEELKQQQFNDTLDVVFYLEC